MVLNGDSSVTGFATSNPANYAVSCAAPGGVATSGGASLTLALDETENALFQTGAGSTTPAVVGRGVPYSGTNCSNSPALAAGGTGAKAVLSTEDIYHKRLYVVSTGSTASPDTITGYNTTGVGYYSPSAQALTQPIPANLDTGGTYTSAVVDTDGLYGDAVVTELRTETSTGGTWVYSYTFGKATKLLGPGGVDLPAINSFIIHNPNDGGGGLLVLVNQDGLTSSNLTNPPLDTTPFTIIDLGQLHELLSATLYPRTLTLPAVTTIPSSLSYYAMLGAVYNPGDRNIYAVVGGGTSLANIQRQIVRYGVSPLDAPTETAIQDVSIVPLSSAQATQLAINSASGTLQILAKDSNRLFTASILTSGPVVKEITGSTFSDSNFLPTYISSNSLLGETYIASLAQVDVLTRPAASKMQAVLDLTGPEVQQTVGQGYVRLLGMFPDISDSALSTATITITATPVIGGSAFIFATVNAGQTLTLPTSLSGTFPAANIYNLVASYPGDAQYAAATSAPVTIAVGQAYFSTSITATAGFNSGTGAGSATVTLAGSTYVPGGTIDLKSVNSGLTLATFYLSGGISNPMVIPFTAPPSTTAIVATYSGDSKNQGSTTGNVALTQAALVTPAITATVPATGTVNTNVHFPLSFTSTTTNAPTGTITIFASSSTTSYALVGTVSASSAFATGGTVVNWTPSVSGSFSIYAQYGGDSNYNAVTSRQIGSIVIGGTYTFTMSSPTTATAGTPFNVVVTASTGATATGNVTVNAFKLGTTTPVTLGTVNAAAAAGGGATLAATIPGSGVYFLNGNYAGDANYLASSSVNTPTVNVTTGTTPAVTLTPASVSLTAVVGASIQRSFLLFNTGGVGLNISGIAVAGQGFSQFNGCPTILQSGTNCTINVVFVPTASGTFTGTLSITDNATGSPHTSALTGTATASSATAFPSNVAFIDQTVGTGSFLRPKVSLINSGTTAFSVMSVTLSSTPDFEITTSPCSSVGSLPAGGNCTVSLEFHPTTVGAKTATLTFTTSSSAVAQSVTLGGNGLSGNPATPPNCVDSDGDGLCDDWETNGVWVRTSSTAEKFVDLPSMGADWHHKDIFIQADYMATGDHTHKLKLTALAQLISSFDVSPVVNPDGTNGIHLHIDCGYDCVMDTVKNTLWGTKSVAQELAEVTPLDTVNVGRADNFDWTKFDAASTSFNASGRKFIFHHLIMAHDLRAKDSTGGISRNGATLASFRTGASDFLVSLGSWTTDMMGTALNQSSTLMHELGHNLGLEHGGNNEDNYKPNYLTVMNYAMQINGLIVDGQNGYIDYSRFTLPILDEAKLNEQVGMNVTAAGYPGSNGSPSADRYGTYFFCNGDDPSKVAPQQVNSFTGNVNWNCNQFKTVGPPVTFTPYIDKTLVRSDVNGDGFVTLTGGVSGLTSFTDWPALVYTGGAVAGNGVGSTPPMSTPSIEITEEQASLSIPPFGIAITGMGRVHTAPGSQITLRFLLRNFGLTNDSYALTTTMQNSWPINTAAPASVSIVAGGQAEVTVTYTVPPSAANGSFDKLFVTVVSQTAPQIKDSVQVETYATTTPLPDAVSTSAVNFGSQTVALTGGVQGVVILNTGNSVLSFGSVTTTTEFAQANNCGTSLAVGASCMVDITFTPAASGARTGTLTINDGTGTPKTVALTGTGVPPSLSFPAVTLTATPAVTSTGQTVTLSVNVATLTSVPTGTVTITNGTTQYGQVALDASGHGMLTTSSLGSSTYSLYAVYSGDTTYRGSNSSYTPLTIVAATPITVTLTASAAAVATGANVTFTAMLGGGSSSSQPTGNVTFLDGTTVLGTGLLNASGVATFATTTLTAGTHAITARYGGDNMFGGAVSTAVTETVGIFATTNTLTASATTVVTGAPVTLTATLTATTATPTGTVTFLDGMTTLGTGTLNGSGVAPFSATALAIGTHSITAQYAATGNFSGSTSSAVQIVVTGAPDFSVSANPTTLTVTGGSSGTAVFTVTPVNGYAGTLSFSCGTLPTYASCSFAPTKLTFAAPTQVAQTTTLTFATTQTTALLRPPFSGRGPAPISLALGLPFGLLALGLGWKGRKTGKLGRPYLMLIFAALAGVAGLSGCASNSVAPATPAGTYTVPVTLTDGTTSHLLSYSVTVK